MLRDEHYIPISLTTPLLSNLNVIENIALIQEVHQRLSRDKAHANALHKLRGLKLERLAHSRIATCNSFEIFSLMLVRASMMPKAKIVIALPRQQFHTSNSIEDMITVIYALAIEERVSVLDLVYNADEYEHKGVTCHINE